MRLGLLLSLSQIEDLVSPFEQSFGGDETALHYVSDHDAASWRVHYQPFRNLGCRSACEHVTGARDEGHHCGMYSHRQVTNESPVECRLGA